MSDKHQHIIETTWPGGCCSICSGRQLVCSCGWKGPVNCIISDNFVHDTLARQRRQHLTDTAEKQRE